MFDLKNERIRKVVDAIDKDFGLWRDATTEAKQEIKSLYLKQLKIEPIKITNKNDVHIGNITFKKGTTGYKCPVCGRLIIYGDKYCRDCGQGILWEMEA